MRFDVEGKRIDCATVSDTGQVFAEAVLLSRRGGGELEKIAGRRHPEVDAFLRTLKPDPKMQYVLMTPMGASEYWGRNINGDYFPEMGLEFDHTKGNKAAAIKAIVERFLTPLGVKLPAYPIREFGHKTFLDALRYRHHVNKDPNIAYGDIVVSVWNPYMKRVEVVVRHWRERARELGAEDIIKDLDEGRPRQISMGCKVPFDVCTICGHVSRTTDDYCDHLKNDMGSIYPDGRVVAALNLFPRFFDLSDVTVPAASESGVIEKVAAARGTLAKTAVMVRQAEISKRVTPNVGARAVVATSAREPDLPTSLLRAGGLESMLTSLAALGIVLKPIEFQFSVLVRTVPDVAASLMARRCCFTPYGTSAPPMPLRSDALSGPLLSAVPRSVLSERSGLDAFLQPRVLGMLTKTAAAVPETSYIEHEDLAHLAEMYDSYRKGLTKVAELVAASRRRFPAVYATPALMDLDAGFTKIAGAETPPGLAECSLAVYVVNAYRVEPVDVAAATGERLLPLDLQ